MSSRSTWRTVIRGLSEEYGSWKTICTARLSSTVRCRPISRPSRRTTPALGAIWPTMHLRDGRLAATRLADESENLTFAHLEAHVLDRTQQAAVLGPEAHREVLDLHDRLSHGDRPRAQSPRAGRLGSRQLVGVDACRLPAGADGLEPHIGRGALGGREAGSGGGRCNRWEGASGPAASPGSRGARDRACPRPGRLPGVLLCRGASGRRGRRPPARSRQGGPCT